MPSSEDIINTQRRESLLLNIQKCLCLKDTCVHDTYLDKDIHLIKDVEYLISNNLPALSSDWLENYPRYRYWVDDIYHNRLCLISEEIFSSNFISFAKYREQQIDNILN